MFDIGFTELLLVGLVALMVLGPERLPGAVRTTGLWVGRLKRSFSNIKPKWSAKSAPTRSAGSCTTSASSTWSGR